MTEKVYDKGAEIIMQTTIRDRDKTLVDPSSVVLTVKAPDGTTSAPTVSRDSQGVYEGKIVASQSGRYRYRWATAGGDFIGADEESFSIRTSSF